MNNHIKIHIQDIIFSYKTKNQWNGKLTIIYGTDGKEYAWNRILSTKERLLFIKNMFPNTKEPTKRLIESSFLINYIFYDGQDWNVIEIL